MEKGRLALTRDGAGAGNFRLDGKVAVITGAGSGIGRAIALRFSAGGATVRVLDLNRDHAEAVAQEIIAAGGEASAHVCDVTDQRHVAGAFSELFKLGRVHVLVNNAGVSHIGTAETTSEADFDRVLLVNVKGFYNCIHICVGHLKANGGGVILNMASTAGSAGLADRFAYSTSKGAVIAMTYSVARDYLPHNIRCNCISPARVHTPFVDDYLQKIIRGAKRKCLRSSRSRSRSAEWASPKKSPRSRFFSVPMRRRSLRAWIIHWMEASLICTVKPWT